MPHRHTAVPSYKVEVSGWDAQQRFFIENTELEWNEQTGKRIRLRTLIRRDAILFLRLFDPGAFDALPVVYQAREIQRDDASPLYRVTLAPVEPQRLRRSGAGAMMAGSNWPEEPSTESNS